MAVWMKKFHGDMYIVTKNHGQGFLRYVDQYLRHTYSLWIRLVKYEKFPANLISWVITEELFNPKQTCLKTDPL